MDQQLTNDGQPYAPFRFKEIIKERYLISKNMNTSYNDVGKITPFERENLIKLILDEVKESKRLTDDKLKQMKQNKK